MLSLLPAVLLPLLAWAATRFVAKAWTAQAVWLDLLTPVAGVAILLGATDLPVLSGVLAALPLAGLALADATKRVVLDEPVVFSDAAMLPLVVRHPSLYLPFAGTHLVLGGVLAGLVVLSALLVWEPRLGLSWTWRGALIALGLGLVLGPLRAPPQVLRQALARDPWKDTARFGLLATLSLYRAVARAERPARQARFPVDPPAFQPGALKPHVVLVQAESFWDPRGALENLPPGLMKNWDELGGRALARGRLQVPGFGANTMRAECAALTGIDDASLGLDRFNPYFRFVVPGLRSIAHTLGAAGYRSRILHPFDRLFFSRHRVMPALGFERFESLPDFAGAKRVGPHVADEAVGRRILDILSVAEEPTLIFAITMQAHGPWPGDDPQGQWLAHLGDADAMLGSLAEAAAMLERPLVLCAYGDHQPALPGATHWPDRRTNWLIWRSDRQGSGPQRDAIAADIFHILGQAIEDR